MFQTVTLKVSDEKGEVAERTFIIHNPSFAALDQMAKSGYNVADLRSCPFDFGYVSAFLAGALSDLEPRTAGVKNRIWLPGDIAENIAPDAAGLKLAEQVAAITVDFLSEMHPDLLIKIDRSRPEGAVTLTGIVIDRKEDKAKADKGDALPPVTESQKKSTGSEKPSEPPASSTSTSA